MTDRVARDAPPDVESALIAVTLTEPVSMRARHLANSLNRAAALLHRLARDQASERKGAADWSSWAKLVNASRSVVLAASMCREVAAEISTAADATAKHSSEDAP